MNAQVKNYLIQNSFFLRNMDCDNLYKGLPVSSRCELTSFMFEHGYNPLKYMTTIPEGMFNGVTLDKLEIPSRITSGTIVGLEVNNIVLKAPNSGKIGVKFSNCTISGKLIIEDGPTRLPSGFLSRTDVHFLKLPESIIRLDNNCIDFSYARNNFIIATPNREAGSRLVIPKNEMEQFKKYLRWLIPKEEVI